MDDREIIDVDDDSDDCPSNFSPAPVNIDQNRFTMDGVIAEMIIEVDEPDIRMASPAKMILVDPRSLPEAQATTSDETSSTKESFANKLGLGSVSKNDSSNSGAKRAKFVNKEWWQLQDTDSPETNASLKRKGKRQTENLTNENGKSLYEELIEAQTRKKPSLRMLPLRKQIECEQKEIESMKTSDKSEVKNSVRLENIDEIYNRVKAAGAYELKTLYRVIYDKFPFSKMSRITDEILEFGGFPFSSDSPDYWKRKKMLHGLAMNTLQNISKILGLGFGSKDLLTEEILKFLMKPTKVKKPRAVVVLKRIDVEAELMLLKQEAAAKTNEIQVKQSRKKKKSSKGSNAAVESSRKLSTEVSTHVAKKEQEDTTRKSTGSKELKHKKSVIQSPVPKSEVFRKSKQKELDGPNTEESKDVDEIPAKIPKVSNPQKMLAGVKIYDPVVRLRRLSEEEIEKAIGRNLRKDDLENDSRKTSNEKNQEKLGAKKGRPVGSKKREVKWKISPVCKYGRRFGKRKGAGKKTLLKEFVYDDPSSSRHTMKKTDQAPTDDEETDDASEGEDSIWTIVGNEEMSGSEDEEEEEKPVYKGVKLMDFPKIRESVENGEKSVLQRLHVILYGTADKLESMKKNILNFSGFQFEKNSDDWNSKKFILSLVATSMVREYLELLHINIPGDSSASMIDCLMDFLMAPGAPSDKFSCAPHVQSKEERKSDVSKKPKKIEPVKKPKKSDAMKKPKKTEAAKKQEEAETVKKSKKIESPKRLKKVELNKKPEIVARGEKEKKEEPVKAVADGKITKTKSVKSQAIKPEVKKKVSKKSEKKKVPKKSRKVLMDEESLRKLELEIEQEMREREQAARKAASVNTTYIIKSSSPHAPSCAIPVSDLQIYSADASPSSLNLRLVSSDSGTESLQPAAEINCVSCPISPEVTVTVGDTSGKICKNSSTQTIPQPLGGRGKLGEIAHVKFMVIALDYPDLDLIHNFLFLQDGVRSKIRRNILEFDGFPFDEEAINYKVRKEFLVKIGLDLTRRISFIFGLTPLRNMMQMDVIANMILRFLMAPIITKQVPIRQFPQTFFQDFPKAFYKKEILKYLPDIDKVLREEREWFRYAGFCGRDQHDTPVMNKGSPKRPADKSEPVEKSSSSPKHSTIPRAKKQVVPLMKAIASSSEHVNVFSSRTTSQPVAKLPAAVTARKSISSSSSKGIVKNNPASTVGAQPKVPIPSLTSHSSSPYYVAPTTVKTNSGTRYVIMDPNHSLVATYDIHSLPGRSAAQNLKGVTVSNLSTTHKLMTSSPNPPSSPSVIGMVELDHQSDLTKSAVNQAQTESVWHVPQKPVPAASSSTSALSSSAPISSQNILISPAGGPFLTSSNIAVRPQNPVLIPAQNISLQCQQPLSGYQRLPSSLPTQSILLSTPVVAQKFISAPIIQNQKSLCGAAAMSQPEKTSLTVPVHQFKNMPTTVIDQKEKNQAILVDRKHELPSALAVIVDQREQFPKTAAVVDQQVKHSSTVDQPQGTKIRIDMQHSPSVPISSASEMNLTHTSNSQAVQLLPSNPLLSKLKANVKALVQNRIGSGKGETSVLEDAIVQPQSSNQENPGGPDPVPGSSKAPHVAETVPSASIPIPRMNNPTQAMTLLVPAGHPFLKAFQMGNVNVVTHQQFPGYEFTVPKKTEESKPADKTLSSGILPVNPPVQKVQGTPEEITLDDDEDDDDEITECPSDEDLFAAIRDIIHDSDPETLTLRMVHHKLSEQFPEIDIPRRKDFIKTAAKNIVNGMTSVASN